MSLFYDRDRNITGVALLTGFSFDPSYGSSVSFTTKNNYVGYTDKIGAAAPNGINSVVGEFSLNFPLRETDAVSLMDFYESQSGSGVFGINDDSDIYRPLSGTIESLSIDSANNNKYDVNLKFNVERNAAALKWSGQSFVKHSFQRWNTGINFSAYDIVYFENDLENPESNFFYCTGDHVGSFSNHPLSTGQKWTQNLFLDTNDQFSVQQKPMVGKNEFQGSFIQRNKEQKNIHAFESLDISYKNISDKKTKALLHFLESRLGYKKFQYQLPKIYNRPKLFFAPSWNHQWNYKDSNNVNFSAIEDPFGSLASGNPSIHLIQESGKSFLAFSITGSDRIFYDTGNGKELFTTTLNTLTWPSTGSRNQVKIYGRVAGFTGRSQGLVKSQISAAKSLTHFNISGNNVSVLNLYDAPNLTRLSCPNNSIGGLDVGGKPFLTYVDYSNNNGAYFNIGGSTDLTGIYAKGNKITTVCVDSALSALVDNGKYSGYANFSGSSGISASSLGYRTTLTGRSWTLGYQYYPTLIAATTTTAAPRTSGYLYSGGHSSSSSGEATGGLVVYFSGNSPSFATSSKINFKDDGVLKSGASHFWIYEFNSASTLEFNKICCDIASSSYVPPPTTTIIIPPLTTTPTSTTTPPWTTTTTTPMMIFGCTDPLAINFNPLANIDDGSCIY